MIDLSLRKQYKYETELSQNETDNTVGKYYKSNCKHEQLTQNISINIEITYAAWRRCKQEEDSKMDDQLVQEQDVTTAKHVVVVEKRKDTIRLSTAS